MSRHRTEDTAGERLKFGRSSSERCGSINPPKTLHEKWVLNEVPHMHPDSGSKIILPEKSDRWSHRKMLFKASLAHLECWIFCSATQWFNNTWRTPTQASGEKAQRNPGTFLLWGNGAALQKRAGIESSLHFNGTKSWQERKLVMKVAFLKKILVLLWLSEEPAVTGAAWLLPRWAKIVLVQILPVQRAADNNMQVSCLERAEPTAQKPSPH